MLSVSMNRFGRMSDEAKLACRMNFADTVSIPLVRGALGFDFLREKHGLFAFFEGMIAFP